MHFFLEDDDLSLFFYFDVRILQFQILTPYYDFKNHEEPGVAKNGQNIPTFPDDFKPQQNIQPM